MIYRFFAFVTLSLALGLSNALADMVIDTTRVIYPEAKRDVSFKVTNSNKDRPAFVQMWLDDGNSAAAPEDTVTPFNLTPPVARLKADGSQVVRLVFTGEPLPADRESVFYFNMLEVPQKGPEENKLSFAVRTRIKVFFRPKALKGDPIEQLDKVTWKVVKKDNQWVAEGTNPTPYHFSFFGLVLGQDGKFDLSSDGGMLAPKSSASFVLGAADKVTKPYNGLRAEYISDYGGAVPKDYPINLRP